MDSLTMAREYEALGLAVFPLPHGEKADARQWGTYRFAPPDAKEINLLFGDGPRNIAVIAGTPSGNLLALDCDSPDVYTETAARFAALGIDTWTVRREPNGSPHDGGGTFVLRTPEPVRSTKRDSLDVLAEGRYFVAPPSAHPGGGLYYNETDPPIFEIPDLAALAWLDLEPAPPRNGASYRWLPDLAYRILTADPETLRQYPTRSEAEAALCASLARSGRAFEDALRLLRTYPGPGKFAELDAANSRNALRYLGLTWTSAKQWIHDTDNETGQLAVTLRRWALSRAWPGRGASSDRAVYLAHLEIVERCGKDPHGASCRELAELAGVSWKTASNANHRLVEQELLQLGAEATPTCPHVWSLRIPDELVNPETGEVRAYLHTPSIQNVTECVTMHERLDHDAFRWSGLNKSGAEVLGALQRMDEGDVNELVAATGRHRTTVKRKLRLMLSLGLVVALGDGYWAAVDDPDLDQAARDLNVAGKGAEERRRHVRDRRYQREILERGRS